jgi:hypothetical protein
MDYRKLLTTNLNEARIVLSRLTADGIVAEIRGPSSSYPIGAATVYVLSDDFDRANDLLDVSHEDFDDVPTALAQRRSGVMRAVGALLVVALAMPFVMLFVSLVGRVFD